MKRFLLLLFICLSSIINAREVKTPTNFFNPVGVTIEPLSDAPEFQQDKRKKTVHVKSYKRKNGKVVKAHKRRPPRRHK